MVRGGTESSFVDVNSEDEFDQTSLKGGDQKAIRGSGLAFKPEGMGEVFSIGQNPTLLTLGLQDLTPIKGKSTNHLDVSKDRELWTDSELETDIVRRNRKGPVWYE